MSEAPIIIRKKKGHGGHAHHGGSWKVAYADFVTAMMAFFMVMWIMGLSDASKSQVQGYFNDPLGFKKNESKSKTIFAVKGMPQAKPGKTKAPGDSISDSEEKQVEHLKQKITTDLHSVGNLGELLKDVSVTITNEGLQIDLLETRGAVFFENGQAIIRPGAKIILKHIASILGPTKRKVVVEGHTDARPFSGAHYTNWDLSTDRARALQRELAQDGVNESQFAGIRGFADTKLLVPNNPFDFRNRRVTILLPFEGNPGESMRPKEQLKAQINSEFQQAVDIAPVSSPTVIGQSGSHKPH